MTLDELKDLIKGVYSDDCEVLLFDTPSYADAFIGISTDGRAVYNYDKMIEFLEKEDSMEYDEAAEFVNYNTLRALPYMGSNAPIVYYPWEI